MKKLCFYPQLEATKLKIYVANTFFAPKEVDILQTNDCDLPSHFAQMHSIYS